MEDLGLQALVRPHLESFNFAVEKNGALEEAVKEFPVQILDPVGAAPGCRFWFKDIMIERPRNPDSTSSELRLFPSDCRELRTSYEGKMVGTLVLETPGHPELLIPNINLGMVPIMVRSKLCWLEHMNSQQLIQHKEEAGELGGYFIVNGNERIIRMIIQPRRNQVVSLIRPSFRNRGREYTEFATQIRSVRRDQTGQTITLHYLDTGNCSVRFALRKQEFFLPAVLLLRALLPTTDLEIFQHIVGGDFSNSFFSTRAEIMLRQAQNLGLYTQAEALAYLGKHFRIILRPADSVSDEDCGRSLLERHIFVHCGTGPESGRKKFDCLIFMIRKLFSLVKGEIRPDNIDATSNHEVLLPGHMYFRCMKEYLEDWLLGVRAHLQREQRRNPGTMDLTSLTYIRRILERQVSVGRKLEYFIVTGNLRSNTGMDLQQVSGFTIVADKLNYLRYLSHFRAIHRGNFYTNMKTISVRKLLPEAWGFLCPVHTPDGTPCGLLNHLAAPCQVLTHETWDDEAGLVKLLCRMGMSPVYTHPSSSSSSSSSTSSSSSSSNVFGGGKGESSAAAAAVHTTPQLPRPDWIPVILDGVILGYLPRLLAAGVEKRLRRLKVEATMDQAKKQNTSSSPSSSSSSSSSSKKKSIKKKHKTENNNSSSGENPVGPYMEIILIPDTKDGLFPSLNLQTGSARMMRPVYHLTEQDTETYRRHRQSQSSIHSLGKQRMMSTTQKEKKKKEKEKEKEKKKKRRKRKKSRRDTDEMETDSSSSESEDVRLREEDSENDSADGKVFPSSSTTTTRGGSGDGGGAVELTHVEWVGSQEQTFLEIGVVDSDILPGVSTHREIAPQNILSVVASLTPFSDFNQSPRNMYQCQMGKQTMGTPFHAFPYRVDNKIYRLQTPQRPIVKNTPIYDRYRMDEYPIGTNAIVAVISYTGYDMEDAMIINKSAYERGLMHGSVYQYKEVDLTLLRTNRSEPIHHRFRNYYDPEDRMGSREAEDLSPDGLPEIGQTISPGGNLYCVMDDVTQRIRVHRYDGTEPCIVEEVRHLQRGKETELQVVGFKLRTSRNPVIGDKFSSRHGQKGILSILWPQVDMPWSESGLTPDLIINPHAFPSRMTIGMLVESMAGKVGCQDGRFHDSTPFEYPEHSSGLPHDGTPESMREHLTAVEAFGEQLLRLGYNRVGTERLYSGVTGVEMTADIFLGVVYYQRLRHMVSDKSQVRALGPINNLTRQPVKGRKIHGGIRFGEMERDALLGHGTSFLTHDRLMNASDYHVTEVCRKCGNLLSPCSNLQLLGQRQQQRQQRRRRRGGRHLLQPEEPLGKQEQAETTAAASLLDGGAFDFLDSSSGGSGGGMGGGLEEEGEEGFGEEEERACSTCQVTGTIGRISIPYVFMYLANELAAVNVRLSVKVA